MGQAHDNGTFMQDAHWSPSKEDVPAEIDKRIMAQCVDPESSTVNGEDGESSWLRRDHSHTHPP